MLWREEQDGVGGKKGEVTVQEKEWRREVDILCIVYPPGLQLTHHPGDKAGPEGFLLSEALAVSFKFVCYRDPLHNRDEWR